MANRPTVEAVFAGDATGLQKAMERVGNASKEMNSDLDRSAAQAKGFGAAMDKTGDSLDTAGGKFMGTADLLDGLATTMGLPIDGAISMARGFADLADGMKSVVVPAIQAVLAKLGIMTGATVAQTTATTGAATAQTGLNAALLANPIGIVVAAIAALAAGLVIAWKNSETFRNIVKSTWEVIKDGIGIALLPARLAIEGLGHGFQFAKDLIVAAWHTMQDIFNKIKSAADKALGPVDELIGGAAKLGGGVLKGIGKGIGGLFASGGSVNSGTPYIVGERGPELFVPNQSGGIVPNGKLGGGGGVTVVVQGNVLDGRQLADLVHQALLQKQRRAGNLGFEAA